MEAGSLLGESKQSLFFLVPNCFLFISLRFTYSLFLKKMNEQ